MNCAAKRSQRLWVAQRCAVKGCGALARGRYCERCEEEIESLHEIAAARDQRQERWAQRIYGAAISFELLCARVRRRLWIPTVVAVFCGLAYLFFEFGVTVYEWASLLGGQQ